MYVLPICPVCDGEGLAEVLRLKERGVPHDAPGHAVVHDATILLVCQHCQRGILQVYSHDCWAYEGDEDWEMYWWYVLEPEGLAHLRTWLQSCPQPLDPQCPCALHQDLRASTTSLYAGVPHTYSPHRHAPYARLVFSDVEGVPTLRSEKK
ncbi:MAG TPA: hypothetical protein VKT82_05930 [Ktedonobacterales bacterium]|nr:hypothetical protein [Ktedonobacterales bacterium]